MAKRQKKTSRRATAASKSARRFANNRAVSAAKKPSGSANSSAARAGENSEGDAAYRDRLLDAVECCFLRHGIRKTTVEDVAREAKVSRMTVYRVFKNREELFQNVIFRHAQMFTRDMEAHLQKFASVDEQLLEGILYAMRELPKGPLHSIFFGPDAAVMTARFAITSSNLFALGRYLLEPMLAPAQAQGRLREGVAIEQVQEWLVRVILSFFIVQTSEEWNEAAMRHMVRSFILPSVLKEGSVETNLCHSEVKL